MSKITRVEIIDETGRVFSRWNQNVDISIQDDGQTMKLFIKRDPNNLTTGKIDTQPLVDIVMSYYKDSPNK